MSNESHWLERARKLVSYHSEALEFISRVADQLEVTPADAPALSLLWVEADALDEMVCSLLNEMNDSLIEGVGELDITRGASVRPDAVGGETVFYECSWSLMWESSRSVSVNLAVEPRTQGLEAEVRALRAGVIQRTAFPVAEPALKESLVGVYAAEAVAEA